MIDQMNDSPRARLGPAASALRWFFEPADDLNEPERSFMLGQLFGSPLAAMMGSFCAFSIIGVALLRSGSAIYGLLAALEMTLVLGRLMDRRRRDTCLRDEPGYVPPIDTSVLLSTLWCTLQGILAFVIMSSGDLVLSVLSATLLMAMLGPICARNYAAPRFAFLLILLCELPFVGGALASREPWLAVIVPITPPFLFGAMQIINTFHRSMLRTLAMQARALHLAEHDMLTGILNRRGMEQALSQMLPSQDQKMALISIDLDGFKQVNDKHGHGAGDRLLVLVAQRLTKQLRHDDLLARMGGDEFVVVVRGMSTDTVGPLADRLIAAISGHVYDLGDGTIARVGASIGFACLPDDAASTAELRLRADNALYAAKGAGKGVGRRYGIAHGNGDSYRTFARSSMAAC